MRSRFCFLIDSSFQFNHDSCPAPLLCRTPKLSFHVLVNSAGTIIWSILIVTLFETGEASQVPLLPLLLSKMICSLYSFSEVEMSLMTGSSITKVPLQLPCLTSRKEITPISSAPQTLNFSPWCLPAQYPPHPHATSSTIIFPF